MPLPKAFGSHCGSVSVEETTYFCTRFGYAPIPVASSVCSGQYSRKASKVRRPTRSASASLP
jgi:hypothetical protein